MGIERIQAIYKNNVGKYATPGSSKLTMSLEEFVTLLSQSHVINENFGIKEAGPLYSVSMMTNKDELENEKHLSMTFVEFLEAICRVADKY